MSKSSKKQPSSKENNAKKTAGSDSQEASGASTALEGLKSYWPEIQFIGLFGILLGAGFTLISLNSVNNGLIVPFTGLIAKASALSLNLMGQGVSLVGSQISNERFGVEILNGCNGVETMIIFLSAVLAFPAKWSSRLVGLALGMVAIQAINLVRVVALFLTGSYMPKLFDSSHTVIWQSIVIAFGVLLFIFWANRFGGPQPNPESA